MRITQIFKDIYLVVDRHTPLCDTFMRPQEYYESPVFKNKCFTQADVLLNNMKSLKESYYDSWAGFNIPVKCMKILGNANFYPLSKEETRFVEAFKYIKFGYILGVSTRAKPDVLVHELSHALFYLERRYRKQCLKVLKQYNLTKERKKLLKMGYDQSVLDDEIIAYFVGDAEYFKGHTDIKNKLKTIYIQELLKRGIIK